MSVAVSLFQLVQVTESRPLWPERFRDLLSACEVNFADRTPFGVIADWCDENEETKLGDAFRWFHRPTVPIDECGVGSNKWLSLNSDAPLGFRSLTSGVGGGLMGMVVKVADQIAAMREAIS